MADSEPSPEEKNRAPGKGTVPLTAPADVEAPMKEANRLFNLKQYQQAEATLRPIVIAHPSYRNASYLLAMTFYRRQRYVEAEALFRRLVIADPTDADAAQGLGVSLDKLGRLDEAIGALEAALSLKPEFPEASRKLDELRERSRRHMSRRDDFALLRLVRAPFTEWHLDPAGMTIGRESDNDIVLNEVGISRHHAELALVGSRWRVKDRGSTNGTLVNEQQVQTQTLQTGDRIQLGSLELEFSEPHRPSVSDQTQMLSPSQRPAESPRPSSTSSGHTPRKPTTLDEAIKAQDLGPGSLIVEGRRMIRSYPGRILLATAIAALGVAVASTPVRELENTLGVSGLDRQDRFNMTTAALTIAAIIVLYAVLSSVLTRYQVYERRVDFTHGMIVRRTDVVWFYEVKDLTFSQPLLLMLAGTGRISLATERKALFIPGKEKTLRITGLESSRRMRALSEKMREEILAQRRALKGIWI